MPNKQPTARLRFNGAGPPRYLKIEMYIMDLRLHEAWYIKRLIEKPGFLEKIFKTIITKIKLFYLFL